MGVKPTDILEKEHCSITRVIGAMNAVITILETGGEIDAALLRSMVDFMRFFADEFHHGKEEAILFPLLDKRGVPIKGCPIGVLVHDHQVSRILVTRLADAIESHEKSDPDSQDTVLKNLQSITRLYPGHIWKEEYLLFPMTNKLLSEQDQIYLTDEFLKVDKAINQADYIRFTQFANSFGKDHNE